MEWDSIKCRTCEHAFDQLAVGVQREDISEEFDHHASLASFQAAVKEGCHLCNIVWDEWKLSDDQNKPPAGALTSFQMIYRLYVAFGRGPQYIWFGYRIDNREKSGSREEEPGDIGQVMAILWTRKRPNDETLPVPGSELLQTKGSTFELKDFQHNFTDLHADSPPNPRRMMKLGIPVADLYSQAGSTASEWNLRLARAWLEDCVANHPLCEQRTTQKLPTRVLDVGSEPCDLVRLHISSEGECGSYATLSHCWGRKHLLMLEKDTESMLKAGIELSQLPNTFRDTILVARALSIKYIWIDSLCIYQDSTEDWRTESTKMGQIYMNCLLNIAATASEDSSGGLFRPRNPLAVKPAQITINAGYSIGKYDFWCWPGFLWDRQVEEGVLNTRGWVFQERLLAPRIVHFSSQLFWDCRMSAACETIPTGRPTPMPSRQKSPYRNFLDTIQLKKAPNLQRTSDTHEPEIEEVYTAWQEIVTTYSNRKFTKDSDILVAISGIAQEIQRGLTNYDQYYVGHWLQNLKKELLWSVGPLTVDTKANFTTSRICPLRAPTWAWASVKGPIHFKQYVQFQSLIGIMGLIKKDGDGGDVEVESVVLAAPLLEAVVFDGLPFELPGMDGPVGNSGLFSRFVEVGDRFMMGIQLRPDDPSYVEAQKFQTRGELTVAVMATTLFGTQYEGLWLEKTDHHEHSYERVGRIRGEILPIQRVTDDHVEGEDQEGEDQPGDEDWQPAFMEALLKTAKEIEIF